MKQLIDQSTGEILKLRTPYNYNRDEVSLDTGTDCGPETRTQQQFKDECNITKIMERFGLTGEIPQNVKPVMPGEYNEIGSYQDAMNLVRKAQEAFMEMPSGVRSRFQNNPHLFTEFLGREENRLEAEKMGLVMPRAPEPIKTPPTEGGT